MDYVIDKTDWYFEVVKEDPSSSLFVELAELLYEDGKIEEMVQVCKTGLEAQPQNIKGKLFLALGLLRLGQKEDAERMLLELREEIKCFSKLFLACGEIENERDNRDLAVNLLKVAYALNPDDIDVLKRLEEWNVSGIRVIDVIPRTIYIRDTKDVEPSTTPQAITPPQEPQQPEEEKEEKPEPSILEFAKVGIQLINEKMSRVSDDKSKSPTEGTIFDEEIKQNIKKYILLTMSR